MSSAVKNEEERIRGGKNPKIRRLAGCYLLFSGGRLILCIPFPVDRLFAGRCHRDGDEGSRAVGSVGAVRGKVLQKLVQTRGSGGLWGAWQR